MDARNNGHVKKEMFLLISPFFWNTFLFYFLFGFFTRHNSHQLLSLTAMSFVILGHSIAYGRDLVSAFFVWSLIYFSRLFCAGRRTTS